MPRISPFYGIVIAIAMYYRDHHPPHFLGEWASLHREELEANRARAEGHLPLATIDPLP